MAESLFLNAPFRGHRAMFPRRLPLLPTWRFDRVRLADPRNALNHLCRYLIAASVRV